MQVFEFLEGLVDDYAGKFRREEFCALLGIAGGAVGFVGPLDEDLSPPELGRSAET